MSDSVTDSAQAKGYGMWDLRFLEMAHLTASWSKDPSTKVGCVLIDDRRIVRALGYNGFPRGVRDDESRMINRPRKYLFVQHAEANALTNANGRTRGCTAYVTHSPCANCMGLMVQAGIQRVVTHPPEGGLLERFADSFEVAHEMRCETGIEIVFVPVDAIVPPVTRAHRNA